MAIDGQYKQELIENLKLLLKEGLDVRLYLYVNRNNEDEISSISATAEIFFYDECVDEVTASSHG